MTYLVWEDDNVRSQRKELKHNLDLLYEYRATGYHIRSRAKWAQDGEKSSKYFLSLEKERQSSNVTNSLKDSTGQVHHSYDGILQRLVMKISIRTGQHLEMILTLTSTQFHLRIDLMMTLIICEGLLTYDECLKSLNKMKKSPLV